MKKSTGLRLISILCAVCILCGSVVGGINSLATGLASGTLTIADIEQDFKAAFHDSVAAIGSSAVLITDDDLSGMENKKKYDDGGYTSLADYLFSVDADQNLVRDRDYGTYQNRKTGFLYYKEKMTDFEISFDFRLAQSTSWNGVYVGFGAQTIGELWANDADQKGNSAIFLQGHDHNVMSDGSTTNKNEFKLASVNYGAVTEKYAADNTSWFTFKLTMTDGKAQWWMDNTKVAEYTPSNYSGGYVYFGTMTGNAAFRNIKVKSLDLGYADMSGIEKDFTGAIYDTAAKDISSTATLVTQDTVESLEKYNDYKNGGYTSLIDYMFSIDDEGNLVRDRDYGTSGNKKIGYMYYKTRMTDFTIEFEYRHSTAASGTGWQTMYVGFGAQKIGGFAEADALSGAVRIQPKEMYSFWKQQVSNYNNNADYKPTAQQFEADKASGTNSWHTFKMTVKDETVTWYVNGKAFSREIKGYLGGYVYLAAMTKDTAFRNIKVTGDEAKPDDTSKYKVYYAKNGTRLSDSGVQAFETDFENCWSLSNGTFTRIGTGEYAGGNKGRYGESLLYFADKKYDAFTLEFDYNIGANKNTWRWAAAGFGADSIGSHYGLGDGYMAFIEQEGYVAYHHPNGTGTKSDRINSTKNQTYLDAVNTGDSWHHFKLTVQSGTMSVSYDNGPVYTAAVDNYGGYVYLNCFVPEMKFRNVSITELENEDDRWSQGYDAYYIGTNADYRTAGTEFKATEPKKVFSYTDETIIRSGAGDFAPSTSGTKGMAALTFKDSYKNFVLEYDYSFAGNNSTWKWTSVGFGAQNSGDHFAGKGGFLAFVEQEGYRSYFKGAKSNRFGGAIADYEALVKNSGGDTSWHHFKLVVTGDTMELYLDNYEGAVQNLSDYSGGYVSIYSNVAGMKFKNITITEIDYITSTEAISDITAEVGTDKNAISLPTSVNVTLASGGTATLPVKQWVCENYDANTAGIYMFEGTLDLTGTTVYKGDKNATVRAVVNIADYDTSAVTKYTFTNESKLDDIFYSYYYGADVQIGKNNAVLKPTSAANTWDITESGGIKRTGAGEFDGTSSGNKGHAALYFKEKYDEFELDFDYCFNGTTGGWKWMAVGVGAQTAGKTAYEDDGELLCLEQEGQIRMLGEDYAPLITPAKAFTEYAKSLSDLALNISTWHHIKVAVKNGTFYMYVDDNPVATAKLEDYKAGHFYIMAATKNLEIKNITVSKIKTASVVSEIPYRAVPLGTAADDIELPATLKIKVDGKTVECPVEWTSADYNGGSEGTYVFYAEATGKYSHYWLSDTAKRAIACVTVGNIDDEVTHSFALNSLEELDAYFTNYYSANDKALSEDGEWLKTAAANNWALSADGLSRAGTGRYSGGAKGAYGAAALYYNKKLKNFEVEFDYRHGTGGWRWFQFGFGAKAIGHNYYDSGYLAYVEREGDVTINGTVKKALDFKNPFPSDRFMDGYKPKCEAIWKGSGEWFHLRLTVVNGVLYIYVDDYPVWKCSLDSGYAGGYIYLIANSAGTQIRNLSITDLDAKEIVIKSIQSAKELGCEVQYIDKTKGDALDFPTSAVVTDTNGYKYNLPVEWKAGADYRSGKLGTFTFSGVPVLPSGKFKNPNNVSSAATVINTKVDYNTKNSIKYYFDHENDLLDFTNYYTENISTAPLAQSDWRKQWTLDNGTLQRINDGFSALDGTFKTVSKIARLTYNKEMQGNYQVEYEYKQDSATWMWPMICFSIKDKTKFMVSYKENDKKFVKQPSGGTAVYLEREGSVNFWGNMVSTNLDDVRIRLLRTIEKFDGYDSKKPHKIKFTFIDGVGRIAVDDYETTVAARIPDRELGEYFALMTNGNAGYFDNVTITKLSDTLVDTAQTEIKNVHIKDESKVVKAPVSTEKQSVTPVLWAAGVVAAAAIIFFVSLIVLYKSKSKKTERK